MRRDSVSSDIRRMNSSAASTNPTDTATTMSTSTVRRKQVRRTITSLLGATRTMPTKLCSSAMFQATKTIRAASDAIGT